MSAQRPSTPAPRERSVIVIITRIALFPPPASLPPSLSKPLDEDEHIEPGVRAPPPKAQQTLAAAPASMGSAPEGQQSSDFHFN